MMNEDTIHAILKENIKDAVFNYALLRDEDERYYKGILIEAESVAIKFGMSEEEVKDIEKRAFAEYNTGEEEP